jgi:hypothetical protein
MSAEPALDFYVSPAIGNAPGNLGVQMPHYLHIAVTAARVSCTSAEEPKYRVFVRLYIHDLVLYATL